MNYKKIDISDYNFFVKIITEKYIFTNDDELVKYSKDETEDLSFLPEIVLKPSSVNEVAKILTYCNSKKIPVTPCGARTGLSGGSLPVRGGVLLSMERFKSIIEIDENNMQATLEPGVINQNLRDAVEELGLFYPPDPASKGSCFIGGNIAENAGGPKALKYGVTKDYILNLEVVLATGEIIWTGANVLKNSTGYNLTQLFVGSEGTLGIVTKIVVKLISLPKKDISMLVPFSCIKQACLCVSEIFKQRLVPSALEFIERDAIDWTLKYTDIKMNIDEEVQAHLLIEFDGNNSDSIFKKCEKASKILENYNCGEIILAESSNEKQRLWHLRRSIGEAVKANSIYKEQDTVVPRAKLPDLVLGVKSIGTKYGFKSVCYGHAGDGNLHINIIKGQMTEDEWNNKLKEAIKEIFKLTKKLGGTISGEHGIGYVQKEFLEIVLSKKNIEIQKSIKKIFDPNNILNPEKIFL